MSSFLQVPTPPGLAEAELLEAAARALERLLPCVDPDRHDLDLAELSQVAARAVNAAERLRASATTLRASNEPPLLPGSRSLRELEREHIAATLEQCRWVIEGERGAARLLGLHPNTLRHRLRKLDLHRPPKG